MPRPADDLRKLGITEDVCKRIDGVTDLIHEIHDVVKKIEAQPMPGGPVRKSVGPFRSGEHFLAVSKERYGIIGPDAADVEAAIAKLAPDELVTLCLKAAQQRGMTLPERFER
jgi:hypothetical protein